MANLHGRTVIDARHALLVSKRKGEAAVCECCGSSVRVYKRGLSRRHVLPLARMLAAAGGVNTDVHVSAARAPGGDYAQLRHRGLLTRPHGASVGTWAVTTLGSSWLAGVALVPRWVWIGPGATKLDPQPAVDGPDASWSVHDAYGERFHVSSITGLREALHVPVKAAR